jgi:hypothetical protein
MDAIAHVTVAVDGTSIAVHNLNAVAAATAHPLTQLAQYVVWQLRKVTNDSVTAVVYPNGEVTLACTVLPNDTTEFLRRCLAAYIQKGVLCPACAQLARDGTGTCRLCGRTAALQLPPAAATWVAEMLE